jgi:EAL domain-containing protein (putative c-di-GMP-specific phosphodiesterase class I)
MVLPANDKTANVEHLLHNFTERLERHPFGWRAVVLNLSRLRPDNRRAQQIRIAADTFEGLVRHFEGQIFLLAQGDIVFIFKDADVSSVDGAVNKVRNLFGDDPLVSATDHVQSDGFSTWYDLARDYVKFAGFVQNVYLEEQRRQKRLATIAGDRQQDTRQPMDPAALSELVKIVERADLTNVIRRQPVCAIVPNEAPKAIYREVYVSIPDLRDAVMPKRDIASDRWLFQYLTQTLDRRVLTMLRRGDDSALAHSYSLNLNISTLLSPEFQAFDQNLRSGTRGSIIIEVEKVDIFNDIGAYIFARDYVRERGYRICLDGMTALTLPFIDRERLGIDLVKVFWSPDLNDPARPERAAEVKAAIERVGKSRVVIARCENADAVRFGHESGVHLFQGRHIDRLLSAGSNSAARAKLVPPTPVAAVGAR